MTTVAALYVDPRGPYPALLGPELCWDVERDARRYDGPHPVVVHPPCGPWSRQRHNYRGSEHDCAPRAVGQVRRWGGVLEHPAGSLLFGPEPPCVPSPCSVETAEGEAQHCVHWWDCDDESGDDVHCCRCGLGAPLPLPGEGVDRYGGVTLEVQQVEWGHVARKRTWLYVVGVPQGVVSAILGAPPYPGRAPTHWVSGWRLAKRGGPPPGVKICSAEQRRRTPREFAEALITIARAASSKGAG